jgi:CDP-diacylglycerol--glycerol-3-phosphate 3-phosphatidyltransferase/cardiolipin synthase
MTIPNYITIFRILLIPVYVGLMVYYADTMKEIYLWWAFGVFLFASLTDGIDGWIARRFNQKSELGAILDPLADKGLILSAIFVLSFVDFQNLERFPLWFPILVVSRDVLTVLGAILLHFKVGNIKIEPHFSGKVSTFLQMACILAVMVRVPFYWTQLIVSLTGFFILYSWVIYLVVGIRAVKEGGQFSRPDNK